MSGSWGPPPDDGQQPPPPPPAYPPARRTTPPPGPPPSSRLPTVVAVVGLLVLLAMAGTVTAVVLLGPDDEPRASDRPAPTSTSTSAPPTSPPTTSPTAPPTSAPPTSAPPTSTPPAEPALPDPAIEAAREATSEAGRAFAEAVNTYGPADLRSGGTMGGYRARVEALLTPAFARVFEQSVVPVEARVAAAGLNREGEVEAVGVAELRRSSAQVLVATRVTTSTDETAPVTVDVAFAVSLTKVGGDWRVDGLTTLTGQPGPGLRGVPGGRIEPAVVDARNEALAAAPGRPLAAGIGAVGEGTVEVVVLTQRAELAVVVVTLRRQGDNWVAAQVVEPS